MNEVMQYRGYTVQINTSQYQIGLRRGEWSGAYKFFLPSDRKVIHIAGCGAFPTETSARAKATRCALLAIDQQIASRQHSYADMRAPQLTT